jgi:hypothetical protein
VLTGYPPTNEYAEPFHCSTFGLDMKSGQMHWHILNDMGVDVWELTIGLNILNAFKGYVAILYSPLSAAACPFSLPRLPDG